VLGIAGAEHAEDTPGAATLVVVPVACPVPRPGAGGPALTGTLVVDLLPGSRTRELYRRDRVEAHHFCNFELNPDYRDAFERSGLRTAGVGPGGEVRVVELVGHPFFVATLYLPQRASRPDAPDPLVTGFLAAALTTARDRPAAEATT
jgi:CTP synthase (UTP-ammonia lyase)